MPLSILKRAGGVAKQKKTVSFALPNEPDKCTRYCKGCRTYTSKTCGHKMPRIAPLRIGLRFSGHKKRYAMIISSV